MANSYVEYTNSGSGTNGLGQTTFTAPSKFLNINDIRIKGLNGSTWTELTISSRATTTVTLSATPTSGSYSKIRVFRSSTTESLIDFQAGARLSESDLDTAYQQSLFVAQEVAEDADPEGGSGIGNIVSSQLQLPLTNFSSTGIDDNATSTAITIDSTERVGIGISNPASYDDGGDRLVVGSTSGRSGITIVTGASNDGSINFADGTTGTSRYMGFINYHHNTNSLRLATNAGVRVTIDSDGRLKVGTTADADVVTPTANIVTNASFGVNDGSNKVQLKSDRISFNAGNFFVLNGSAAGVRLINGGTSWTTQSDETLKENIVELSDVLDKVTNIRCVRYNLKNQNSDNVKIGFIAQDWQTNFGEVVEPDEDNKLGISYTETIPVLLKAIQELKTELDNAKARITTLENA